MIGLCCTNIRHLVYPSLEAKCLERKAELLIADIATVQGSDSGVQKGQEGSKSNGWDFVEPEIMGLEPEGWVRIATSL